LGESVGEDGDDRSDEGSAHHKGGEKPLTFSLAGFELKFTAVEKTRGRLTIPASGRGEDWIVKLRRPGLPAWPRTSSP
jgi:serine/threonine-protein kinase HipA